MILGEAAPWTSRSSGLGDHLARVHAARTPRPMTKSILTSVARSEPGP